MGRSERCIPCGKPVRRDEMAAIAAAIRLSTEYGRAYRAYRCPHGNGHHLTTKPLRDGRPTTREETPNGTR